MENDSEYINVHPFVREDDDRRHHGHRRDYPFGGPGFPGPYRSMYPPPPTPTPTPTTPPTPSPVATLEQAIQTFESDILLAHEFVNGPPTASVTVSSGTYPTFPNVVATAQAQITALIQTLTTNNENALNAALAQLETGNASSIATIFQQLTASNTAALNAALQQLTTSNQSALAATQAQLSAQATNSINAEIAALAAASTANGTNTVSLTQNFPASLQWAWNHNAGTQNCIVSLTGGDGEQIYALIDIVDQNNLTVTFTSPESGTISALFIKN